MHITEATHVQFPMIRHAAEVGWAPVSPQDALAKRGGEAGLLFYDEVEKALHRLNPWMTDADIRAVVDALQGIAPTIEGNREMLGWLRGERRRDDEAARRSRPVRLIDFDNPSANVLQVTYEWKLKPPARRGCRADLMFLVNGVPVAIVEHKNPKNADAIEQGIDQLRRYEHDTPELMGAAQLFNVTHLIDYWYGVTWNLSRRFMARWKERPDEEYRFAVQSFFEPTDFLRTLRDWILFYVEDGETRKTVLRQHQRGAVQRIVARCTQPGKRRGLVWHTQGSGKTFTLLTAARLMLQRRDGGGMPTVIVVVDRTELEGQLEGWVARLIGEMQAQDITVYRAESKAELRKMLAADRRGLIISMIHKFRGIPKGINTRDDIYVFIDEAHRSVAKDLGTYLMAALPNSTIIGFTGTPIARTEYGAGTFAIFGSDDEKSYLDKYTIKESIEDETTLPIHHLLAPSTMTVPADRLEREFFELAELEGVTDVEELNHVLRQAVHLKTFLTADDRVEQVAAFVAKHFQENVQPLGYKALLVGVNREACAKYKRALDKLLPPEWSAPIYTKNDDDVIKRPLVADYQLSAEGETETRQLFKQAGKNPQILIVTDKLLTGFDAPLLYCMYLDKPMRDHVLLQAIARVNRPFVDKLGNAKPIGLIVDFVGVLGDLHKALRFEEADVSGVIEGIDHLMASFHTKIAEAKAAYVDAPRRAGRARSRISDIAGEPDASLEQALFVRFFSREAREEFYTAYKDLEILWEILSPSEELRDHTKPFHELADLYKAIRNTYDNRRDYSADLAHKTRQLVQGAATMHDFGDLIRSVTFDQYTLAELRKDAEPEEVAVFNLVRALQTETDGQPELQAVLVPLRERAEQVMKALEERTISGLEALDRLEALAKEKEEIEDAARKSELPPKAFAVFWTLRDDADLAAAEVNAHDFAQKSHEMAERYPNAAANEEELRSLRADLYKPLLKVQNSEARNRIVSHALRILLGGGGDGDDET